MPEENIRSCSHNYSDIELIWEVFDDDYESGICPECKNEVKKRLHEYPLIGVSLGDFMEYTCTQCGHTIIEIIDPHKHGIEYAGYVDTKITLHEKYIPLNNTNVNDYCYKVHCEFPCGCSKWLEFGHDWKYYEDDMVYECTLCHMISDDESLVNQSKTLHDHTYVNNICSSCNEINPNHSHRIGSTLTLASKKEPTCLQNGEEKYQCSLCDLTFTKVIPKSLEHNYGEETLISETMSTNSDTGDKIILKIYSKECTICGDIIEREEQMIVPTIETSNKQINKDTIEIPTIKPVVTQKKKETRSHETTRYISKH